MLIDIKRIVFGSGQAFFGQGEYEVLSSSRRYSLFSLQTFEKSEFSNVCNLVRHFQWGKCGKRPLLFAQFHFFRKLTECFNLQDAGPEALDGALLIEPEISS
jgi:hypothetical protein